MEHWEVCIICSKTNFKNVSAFLAHLIKHKITGREYYNKYIHETSDTCIKCGAKIKTFTFKNGYAKQCKKCAGKDKEIHRKAKQTNLEKYGVDNPAKVPEFMEKAKQNREKTNLERYGVSYAMQNPEIAKRAVNTWNINYGCHPLQVDSIKEKRKKTNLERYGVEVPTQNAEIKIKCVEGFVKTFLRKYNVTHPMKVKEFVEKAKQTNLKRYGFEFTLQVEEFKNKFKNTCMEKYGVDNPLKDPTIREKNKQIYIERYGVDHPMKCEEVKNKSKETCMERYGVDHPSKVPEIIAKISGSNNYRWVEDRVARFEPYTEKFADKEYRKMILNEQNNIDPITNQELKPNCHLHHIDYDKSNDSRENLIFLSPSTHSKTNTHRDEWKDILTKINLEIITKNK